MSIEKLVKKVEELRKGDPEIYLNAGVGRRGEYFASISTAHHRGANGLRIKALARARSQVSLDDAAYRALDKLDLAADKDRLKTICDLYGFAVEEYPDALIVRGPNGSSITGKAGEGRYKRALDIVVQTIARGYGAPGEISLQDLAKGYGASSRQIGKIQELAAAYGAERNLRDELRTLCREERLSWCLSGDIPAHVTIRDGSTHIFSVTRGTREEALKAAIEHLKTRKSTEELRLCAGLDALCGEAGLTWAAKKILDNIHVRLYKNGRQISWVARNTYVGALKDTIEYLKTRGAAPETFSQTRDRLMQDAESLSEFCEKMGLKWNTRWKHEGGFTIEVSTKDGTRLAESDRGNDVLSAERQALERAKEALRVKTAPTYKERLRQKAKDRGAKLEVGFYLRARGWGARLLHKHAKCYITVGHATSEDACKEILRMLGEDE